MNGVPRSGSGASPEPLCSGWTWFVPGELVPGPAPGAGFELWHAAAPSRVPSSRHSATAAERTGLLAAEDHLAAADVAGRRSAALIGGVVSISLTSLSVAGSPSAFGPISRCIRLLGR
ncbi:hypothetical protein [Frankia sp. Cas4]|uniref:hypothetical protein n=1 Tax=Frankia sp. Cas4 TaxID=3073927 RepID=UPI002AD38C2F|nr:hypothetical protein [Frankia sp. Cas4]